MDRHPKEGKDPMPQKPVADWDRFATPIFLIAGAVVLAAALAIHVRFPAIDGESYGKVFSKLPPRAYRIVRPGETVAAIILLAHGAICVIALTRVPRPAAGVWPAVLAVHGWLWWSELCRDWRFVDGLAGDPIWRAVRLGGSAVALLLVARAVLQAARSPAEFGSALADLRRRRCTGFYGAALGVLLVGAVAGRRPLIEPPEYLAVWLRALAAVWFLIAVSDRTVHERCNCPATTPPVGRGRAALRTAAVAGVLYAVAQTVLWVQYPLPALHAVVPGKLYRAGLPGAWGLRLAQQRYGFGTIVGMRTGGVPDYERRFARRHDIHMINPQLDPTFTPEDLVALLSDPAAGTVLLHCNEGVNRTGSWIAAYRHLAQGWSLHRALAEAEQTGGRPVRQSTVEWLHELFPKSIAARPPHSPTR
jgi:hypothetical protein